MGEEIQRRKGEKRKKPSREIRIKTERHRARPDDSSSDMRELQKEIARQQGFNICNNCNQYISLESIKCVHCDR